MASYFNAGIRVPYDNGLRFISTNNNNIALRPPAGLETSYTMTLPTTAGTNGYYLVTDGSGNLGWAGGLAGDVYSNMIIRANSDNITFATASGSANISVDGSNTIVLRVGSTDIVTVDSDSVDIAATTQSTSTTTGALTVAGGVGIAKDIYVGGDVYVEGDQIYTGSITIDNELSFTNVSDDLVIKNNIVDKDILLTANTGAGGDVNLIRLDASAETIEYNGTLVYGVDTFNDSVGAATDIWNGSNISTTKQIILNAASTSNYSCGSGLGGQLLNIMFTSNASGSSANIDFGVDSLYSGDGSKRFLVFSESGQSSSLVYITYSSDTSLNGWRIINTGAQVF